MPLTTMAIVMAVEALMGSLAIFFKAACGLVVLVADLQKYSRNVGEKVTAGAGISHARQHCAYHLGEQAVSCSKWDFLEQVWHTLTVGRAKHRDERITHGGTHPIPHQWDVGSYLWGGYFTSQTECAYL